MKKPTQAAALAIVLAGCSPGADLPLADSGIDTFHRQLNEQDFATIYARSSSEMKKATAQPAFIAFLSAVHKKLGNFRSGSQTGWRDNVTTNGHFVVINYTAKFDRGDANEAFTYRIDDGHAVLVGYNVSSNALIEN